MSDPPVPKIASMPGLAKVRRAAIAARRTLDLVGLRHGWFSSMVEAADIVSEGAVQMVDGVEGYYGSTSLRCRLALAVDGTPDVSALAQLVVTDPNARLRLLRLAHREAVSRVGDRSLGVLTAEISASKWPGEPDHVMLAIDIDVSATLLTLPELRVDNC